MSKKESEKLVGNHIKIEVTRVTEKGPVTEVQLNGNSDELAAMLYASCLNVPGFSSIVMSVAKVIALEDLKGLIEETEGKSEDSEDEEELFDPNMFSMKGGDA